MAPLTVKLYGCRQAIPQSVFQVPCQEEVGEKFLFIPRYLFFTIFEN